MLFNSLEFLVFLPIVFVLYWFVFQKREWQNLLIVIASYVFYGWWDWRFLFLIAFTSVCSYYSGLLIEYYRGRENEEGGKRRQRLVCASNLILNFLILGVFKYYNFFADSLAQLVWSLFHYQLDWVTLNVILPVGISFYTFQALSYTIDVYRKDVPVTKNIIEFCAFISFFPQLVAGPIERAKNLLPQFQRDRHFDYVQAVDGCRQMLWGFFKKVVIADSCASDLNPLWDSYADYSGVSLWLLALLFTFQIYCDFSGYSDIAIGCSRLFGIRLLSNFNYPYLSRSIPEFWRRWHISLMTWFRDYVYIPLGGSRCAQWKVIRNTFIVFGVSGLWHGANWTFVVWGLYHGTLIVLYKLLHVNTKDKDILAAGRRLPSLKELSRVVVTFGLAVVGWVIFRAENISQAWDFVSRMFLTAFDDFHPRLGSISTFMAILLLIVVEYLQRDKVHVLQFSSGNRLFRYAVSRWTVYLAMLVAIFYFYFNTVSQEFIYFQF
jgi:D-alanyl-lipoteichoic acid acyltransferase DltB (MBOAT superfamily)